MTPAGATPRCGSSSTTAKVASMPDQPPPQDPFELFRRLWGPLGLPIPGMAMPTLAFAHGPDWRACVEALGRPGRGLGFVYFTDALVDASQEILSTLKSETGVDDWIGTVGTGVLATGTEYQDGPALAAMVA